MTKTNFVIEQGTYNRSNWEPVPEGEFETLEEAQEAMSDVETNLGWRDLRISRETTNDNVVTGREVVEYGLESEASDEE